METQIMAYKTGGTLGIAVEDEYHLLGENVWADGSDRSTYPPYTNEPQRGTPPPPPPKPFDWRKLGRNVLDGLAIVVGVAALAAFTVATLGAGPLIIGAVAVGAAAAGGIAVGAQAVNVFIPVFKGEEIAINIYDRMRLTGLDKKELETISKNTGLSLDKVTAMKKHLFLTKHANLVDENGKYYYEGYFTPDINVAYGWGKALSTELSPAEKAWFRKLAAHELAESKMMQKGIPIRNIESFKDGKPSDGDPPGAHDFAPSQPGDFPEIEYDQLGDISRKIRKLLDNMEGKDE